MATRLHIESWADISALSFNGTHRAISVCNVLGLSRNERFKAVWNETGEVPSEWFRLFGQVPDVRTGRDHGGDAFKVRLAVYLGIQPPQEVMECVLSTLAGGSDSVATLSDIEEGEESDEEEADEAKPIPGNIHVGGKKRSRTSSFTLKEVSFEQLQEEMERRKAASASAGEGEDEDDNDF